VTSSNIFNRFIWDAFDIVTVSHVHFFLNCPFLIIIIKAVGISINIFVDINFIKHSKLAAASH